jgi:hypothetical protein
MVRKQEDQEQYSMAAVATVGPFYTNLKTLGQDYQTIMTVPYSTFTSRAGDGKIYFLILNSH